MMASPPSAFDGIVSNHLFASTDERGRTRNLGSLDFVHRNIYSVPQRGPTPPQARPEEYPQNPRPVTSYPTPNQFYRQPRPVSTNVPQRNLNTVTISSNQQPIFGQQLPGMFLSGVPLQPPLFLQQSGQHAMQVSYNDLTYTRTPFNQSQYQITQAQPQFMQTANTYFQPPPNTGVYFPQASAPMPVAQNRQTPVQITPPGQTQPPMKEKKIIPITDPNTGRDVTKEILSRGGGSNSTSPPQITPISSARATPPVTTITPSTNYIAAQFAAQVAATLSTDSPKALRPSSPNSRELGSIEKTDASSDIKYNIVGSTSDIKIEPNETIKTDSILNVKENIDSVDTTTLDKFIDKPQDRIDSKKTLETKVNTVSEQIKPDVSSKSEEVDLKVDSNVDVNLEKNIDKKDRTESSKVDKKDTRPEDKNDVSKETIKQDLHQINVKVDKSVIINGDSIALTSTTTTIKSKVDEPEIPEIKDTIPKENGELDISVNSSAIVAECENGAKESKKGVKGKKKMKEINRRGENKEGTDMDAFTDKEEIQIIEENIIKNTECLHDPTEDALALKNERNESRGVSVDSDRSSSDDGRKDKQELKLKYKEDQWSPLNPEGKRHYDRTFLLQMQYQPMSLEKPDGLPKLEVVKDIANKSRTDGRSIANVHMIRQFSNTPDFTPGYVKSSPRTQGGGGGGGGGMGRRTSQQGKARETRKIIHNVSLNSDVKLHETENAWRPIHLSKDKDNEEELSEKDNLEKLAFEDLHRKVRGILNKLTPQKFDTLLEQVITLKIDTEAKLKSVIDLVFDKAVDEPSFSFAYASLCKCLGTIRVPVEGGSETQFVNFRKMLLNRCQKEFEKDINEELAQNNLYKALEESDSEEKKKQISEEIEELENKVKRRSIGNIRFIGELFKLKMLTEKIMHECLVKLLRQNDEDSFECLCRLLTTIGADIDHEKDKIDRYFQQMHSIVDEKKISSRVRFMILDVIDLRKTGWKPRRDENNPKTIDQIHREAEQEMREQQFNLQQMSQHPKRNEERRRGRGAGGSGGNGGMGQTDEGWNTVASKNNRAYDPAKLKLTKHSVDENIQLGPGSHMVAGWMKGSSGGTKVNSQEKESKPSMPANRFSALGEQSAPASDSRNSRSGPPSRDSSKGRGSTQLPPTQRGKPPSNRDNRDREKEQAIAAVKTITGASSIQRHSNSRDRSASQEYTKESEKEAEKVNLTTEARTIEDIEKKTKTILDEYLHINDYAEALQCVSELNSSGVMHIFVSTAINHVLERSVQSRHSIGSLLHDLVKKKIITLDIYLQGLKSVLECADDMSIDIPHIWSYLGELVGPMVQDHSLPLSFLKEIVQPVMNTGKAGLLIAEVLRSASKNVGSNTVSDLWKSSGLQWSDFLSQSESVQLFIEKNNLKFIDYANEVQPDSALSIEAIRDKLKFLIAQNNSENENIFAWIEANVEEQRIKEPQFIRAVMAAVCESAIKGLKDTAEVDIQQFKFRTNLFVRYLDHNEILELHALYELQAVMHRLDHPPGMLRTIFDTLYDEDIISEDAFNSWESSNDPNEQEGKGVALKSLVQFYTWLREADEESE